MLGGFFNVIFITKRKIYKNLEISSIPGTYPNISFNTWDISKNLIKRNVHTKIVSFELQNTGLMCICGTKVEFAHCGQHLLPTVTTQTHTSRCYPHTSRKEGNRDKAHQHSSLQRDRRLS